jgi:ketosteroid isomerase-like protein
LENVFAWEVETMNDFSPRSIVLQFIELVNQGDLDGIASFVSDDVVFRDVHGREFREKDFMENYLLDFPDYKIYIHHVLQGGNGVAILGKTSGSHVPPEIEDQEWLVWTAEVEDGWITEWRIYATDAYAKRS